MYDGYCMFMNFLLFQINLINFFMSSENQYPVLIFKVLILFTIKIIILIKQFSHSLEMQLITILLFIFTKTIIILSKTKT